jgi:hypothetical protein
MRTPATTNPSWLLAQLFPGHKEPLDDLCRDLEEAGLFRYEVAPPELRTLTVVQDGGHASTGGSSRPAASIHERALAVGRDGSAYLVARVECGHGPCIAIEQQAGPAGSVTRSGMFGGGSAWQGLQCAFAHTAKHDVYVGFSEDPGSNTRLLRLRLHPGGTDRVAPSCPARVVEVACGPLSGPVLCAVDEADGRAWMLEQASRRLHCVLLSEATVNLTPASWPAGHEPVALSVHDGRVRLMVRLLLPLCRSALHSMSGAMPAEVQKARSCVTASPRVVPALQLLALTLQAQAPASGSSSSGVPPSNLGVLEFVSSAWRLIPGSSIAIPHSHQACSVVAAPYLVGLAGVGVHATMACSLAYCSVFCLYPRCCVDIPHLSLFPALQGSCWLVLLQPRQEAGCPAGAAVLLYDLAAATWQGPTLATPSSGRGPLATQPCGHAARRQSVWRDRFMEAAASSERWAVAQAAREGLATIGDLGAPAAAAADVGGQEAVAVARAMDEQGGLCEACLGMLAAAHTDFLSFLRSCGQGTS